jgi:hypothetical protein
MLKYIRYISMEKKLYTTGYRNKTFGEVESIDIGVAK